MLRFLYALVQLTFTLSLSRHYNIICIKIFHNNFPPLNNNPRMLLVGSIESIAKSSGFKLLLYRRNIEHWVYNMVV